MKDAHHLAARRLELAEETLAAARTLAEAAHWGACMNRIYFACFYAAGALLTMRGFSTKTHSGLRTLLGQHFAEPGLLSKEHMAFFNRLFNARLRVGYDDFVEADESMRPWIAQAEAFMAVCAALAETEQE